jgi:DNA (cytosine-5)-methyltransferase 1
VDSYKVVSLFCGCGGSDMGILGGFTYLSKKYAKTAFAIAHASDLNVKAIDTYNKNFKHKAEVRDVASLNFCKSFADVVIGGFPCQAFSTVNPTKKPGEESNQLFWQMAKVIEKIKPKIFVAENVKGFYRLSGGKYFNLARNEFASLGYRIYSRLLNSADYGIPQLRERLFIVGIRKDLSGDFYFPMPTHGVSAKKPRVSLGAVIESVVPDNPKYYFSQKAVEGAKRAKPNMKRLLAQDLNSPCLTITSHLAKVSINSRDPVLLVDPSRELYRRFTPREAAAIQSFPGKFVFAGSDSDAYRQIGNAIPPVLFWHLAQSLERVLKGKKPINQIGQDSDVIEQDLIQIVI